MILIEMTVPKISIRDIAYIAVFTALMAVCSWISIPTAIPFTLQTMGVFLAVGLLGGKRGTLAVTAYVLLGAVGAPVFANFSGGLGVLMGQTGGYILWVLGAGMVLGMLVCYAFGTAWFMVVYPMNGESVGLWTALTWCVFPYVVFDLIKIGLALGLTSQLRRHVR